jgi:hypothetical protein
MTCHGMNNDKRCDKIIPNSNFYCAEHIHQRNVKESFCAVTKLLLSEIERKKSVEQRYLCVRDIFDFLVYNKNLVNLMVSFKKTVCDKLEELTKDSFIIKDEERVKKIESYKKHFFWTDLNEGEEEISKIPVLIIDNNIKLEL